MLTFSFLRIEVGTLKENRCYCVRLNVSDFWYF